ncbi:MAG: phosphoribosylanthranilate isomerase [Bacteroidota bacterium]|nr:phosphoribosylanthranilate isomerase [Bacteroidota bacterium]MEC8367379.1 phosphoribosylanthranilate isomerase [Bacteroidota bacterium]MEC8602194.1 phosphoribosylanthranilate isomerase [Bacteroidota bacterium]
MIIKVCGLNNGDNINQLMKLDLDYMGIIFYRKSSRFFSSATLPKSEKKYVAVFVDESLDVIKKIINKYKFEYVQLHGNEDQKYCKEISSLCNIIKAFRINDRFDLNEIEKYSKYCKYFLFDTFTESYGGSGKKFNWNLLLNYNHKKDFILSGGINLELINSIKKLKNQLPNLIGVDLNSKFEIKPGLKDVNRVKKFIKSIKNENT